MSTIALVDRWAGPPSGSWRVTTATRVFVLALATGQTLNAESAGSVGMVLLSLALLAAVACAAELDPRVETLQGAPVLEGAVATVLLVTTDAPTHTLLVYLAVPAAVAALRHGVLASLRVSLTAGLVLLGGWVAARMLEHPTLPFEQSAPWVLIGTCTGLVAAWLSRSARAQQAAQAPYAAAHRLLSELHEVSQRISTDLDSRTVAQHMVDEVWRLSGTSRTSLSILGRDSVLHQLAHVGAERPAEQHVTHRCVTQGSALRAGRYLALPLRVGDFTFGAVLTHGEDQLAVSTQAHLQTYLDEQSLRLHTALLFEEVRTLATSEERGRIAREIHDGVAQEIASLGYLIDAMEAGTGAEGRARTEELRREVTRIVGELRLSIFDLRPRVSEVGGLAGALADHAREVGARGDLRVHLTLDEQGLHLAPAVELELLRVGQEALTNARKHARAENLWVSIANDGAFVTLEVADDGVGTPATRPGHYGLHNMAERAALIGADFAIAARPGGGTVVTVRLPSHQSGNRDQLEGADHGRTHPARR